MWAAIVLALACLSHGIVLIYTAVGAWSSSPAGPVPISGGRS